MAVTYAQQAAAHVLEVRNNGLGKDLTQDQGKLFVMLKHLHQHGEGTGVGLYVVKKIIGNAEGQIEVASKLDQGYTFQVYLPYPVNLVSLPRLRYGAPLELSMSPRNSVLLVDDDPTTDYQQNSPNPLRRRRAAPDG